jgi:hypothetical protein
MYDCRLSLDKNETTASPESGAAAVRFERKERGARKRFPDHTVCARRVVIMTGNEDVRRVEDRFRVREATPCQTTIGTKVSMSTCKGLSRAVPEPEILTHGTGWQVPPGTRWAAGVDFNDDVAECDTFEDSALVELMAYHPGAYVSNATPTTLRGHHASR